MKGKILDYNLKESKGLILSEDGNRFEFNITEWNSDKAPSINQTVDFKVNLSTAESIFLVSSSSDKEKNKIVAGILALFLGGLGVHKFYLGCTTAGIIMLVIFLLGFILLGLPSFIIAVIAFVEALIYFFKSDDVFEEKYVTNKKCWF